MIEAEERIETLNRLLADATKGDDEQRVAGSTDKDLRYVGRYWAAIFAITLAGVGYF